MLAESLSVLPPVFKVKMNKNIFQKKCWINLCCIIWCSFRNWNMLWQYILILNPWKKYSLDRLYKIFFWQKEKLKIGKFRGELIFLWYYILVKKRVSAEEWHDCHSKKFCCLFLRLNWFQIVVSCHKVKQGH